MPPRESFPAIAICGTSGEMCCVGEWLSNKCSSHHKPICWQTKVMYTGKKEEETIFDWQKQCCSVCRGMLLTELNWCFSHSLWYRGLLLADLQCYFTHLFYRSLLLVKPPLYFTHSIDPPWFFTCSVYHRRPLLPFVIIGRIYFEGNFLSVFHKLSKVSTSLSYITHAAHKDTL